MLSGCNSIRCRNAYDIADEASAVPLTVQRVKGQAVKNLPLCKKGNLASVQLASAVQDDEESLLNFQIGLDGQHIVDALRKLDCAFPFLACVHGAL